MKKTQEIIGLPIICISDGMEVGKVKSLIINADKGAIDYIVVDSGIQILGARVIPTDSILGIGEYALTIESDSSINDISKIPAAIDLLQKNIQVKGAKVLTKKGRLIGEIGDIFINEDECCKIIGVEYIADITQKKIRIIPRDNVITFGKNLAVVTDDVEGSLLDSAAQLSSVEKPFEFEKKNVVNSAGEEFHYSEPIAEPAAQQVEAIIEPEPVEEAYTPVTDYTQDSNDTAELEAASDDTENANDTAVDQEAVIQPDSNAASLFEQRQRQYLNGRKATKTIMDNQGNVIVNEGMTITDEMIDEAKKCGKLIELVMNNKA